MHDLQRGSRRLTITVANDEDRDTIYRLRHAVYASELAQHPENAAGRLSDSLDAFNTYITASVNGEVVGFISITPPGHPSYSIDKYLSRDALPFPCDDSLYEVRLLTVVQPYRGSQAAFSLMYAALRWVEAHGATRVVWIGRREILDLYLKAGGQPIGIEVQSGAVTFEVLTMTIRTALEHLGRYTPLLHRLEGSIDWQLDIPYYRPTRAFHGGAFFDAIGDEFDTLGKRKSIINADVLDAWFPPSPKVTTALRENLDWLLRTSPPTECQGMIRTIARMRGVDPKCVLPGAGSSNLIFMAFRQWLTPASRVLILDPMYGEYAHVLEEVVRCQVDRLILSRGDGFLLDLSDLESRFATPYDLVILVNPNSPTGRHVPRERLEEVLKRAPSRTLIWVDETYVEYAGPEQSLEQFAARSENVVVCKSMSKVYALSGVRAAYLCASPHLIEGLRSITPPWAVSLPAQVAAVKALQDPAYYAARYEETHALRVQLVEGLLATINLEIVPSVANFVLCHLPPDGPDAAIVVDKCRVHGLFLRDVATMGSQLGTHALRIGVKDAQTNRQIVEMLTRVLHEKGARE
jgi:histidinol-phosphate/aromatic aminotransferase/cobyric acid decarboxylase-like protein